LRTNLTTRGPAALFHTSQSAVDRIVHHLVPVLARALQPAPDNLNHPWIIDGTPIPVRDQSITAISKNYRRSVNTQIIICSHRRRVVVAGHCWPGNRNDVTVARHTVVQLLDGRLVLGDGGYRSITSITTPRRDHTGRIIRDHRYRAHRRIRARVEQSSPAQGLAEYRGNAAAVETLSTTASTSSPDSGTSIPAINYGSPLSSAGAG
ncbi:transposase, partial [Mycobacterium sp.]|uniref:transposase n=1 Tax=Mycobacterium sp. TaxID=1785 RepID=UPI00333ED05B|nr:hypothetical protein [Mycobacterium sp.]